MCTLCSALPTTTTTTTTITPYLPRLHALTCSPPPHHHHFPTLNAAALTSGCHRTHARREERAPRTDARAHHTHRNPRTPHRNTFNALPPHFGYRRLAARRQRASTTTACHLQRSMGSLRCLPVAFWSLVLFAAIHHQHEARWLQIGCWWWWHYVMRCVVCTDELF
jgi:hypothetical protein